MSSSDNKLAAKRTAVAGPTEYVGVTRRITLDPADPQRVLDPIFGRTDAAQEANDLGQGMRLIAMPHPKTSKERIMKIEVDVAEKPTTRTIAQAPYSVANGAVFVDTVRAALARNAEVEASDYNDKEPVRLEYRLKSSHGGSITLAVVDEAGTPPVLEVAVNSPVTSLTNKEINTPVSDDKPVESIYGLVWFEVDHSQFDFFVNRAYGLSSGKSQNFKDFELVPHNWLRLTVTPQLDKDRVDVGFEVVTLDGKRIALAKAPASLIAGELFKNTVLAGFATMEAQEAAKPGSSTPWESPFYYDDPKGGGVVEVVAKGDKGIVKIAYAVESPKTTLTEVDFVPYQGKVVVPADWDKPDPTCAKLGSKESATGKFDVEFTASSTVLGSKLKAPLKGTIYGTVYSAADVKITGPIPGSTAKAFFSFDAADATSGPTKRYLIDTQLPAGDYQILGFMDIDGNANSKSPDPDEGDPVFIPIGGFKLTCDVQPVTAEFALTLPAGI